jgi:exopolysaccharide biosynthesis polyprenyl glycosylphosphotransferase
MFARRRYLLTALKLLDLAIMLGAFGLAILVPYQQVGTGLTLSQFLHMRVEVHNFFIFLGLATVWHLSLSGFGLYHSRRMSSRWRELTDIVKAISVGVVFFAVVSLLLSIRISTPAFLAAFWLVGISLMVASRLALRHFLGAVRRRGRNLRHLLVVGTNARALAFAAQIEARSELGYQLMGFADNPRVIPSNEHLTRYGLVSDLAGVPAFLRAHVVDEVVMSLPVKSLYAEAALIVAACEEQGIIVRFLSSIFENRPGRAHVDQLDDLPVVTVSRNDPHSVAVGVKRALDISVSALLLVVLSPVAGAVILAIRLTSPGPAHFAQDRLGLNKRRFRLYKFRTMVNGAEARQAELEQLNEATGPVFKIRNDPRITRVGRILRKTSLDELPQLVNVLKGDMSLVGPRPLPVRDYEGFDADWHRRRFSVRPGVTCLWQVNGRSDISFDRWMALDMEYIDTWSLSLDVQILARTIPAVIRGSGAV